MEYKYIWTNNVQTCIICKHDENQTGNISLQSNYNAIIDGSGIFFSVVAVIRYSKNSFET